MIATKYTVFGWNIHQQILADGEEFKSIWRDDTPVELSSNWIFWIKGARTVISFPDGFDDPFFTQQRGQFCNKTAFAGHTYKRGTYVYKAVGETELWCFDYLLNNNSAPDMQLLFIPAGQNYEATAGQLLFVVSGDTSVGGAPLPVGVISQSKTINANTDTALILFSRKNDAV
jgi:hypothetical protein